MRRGRPGRSAVRSRPAHLLRLDAKAMTNALGIAGSLCGGLLEFSRGDGGMVKRLHLGRASEAGVLAASLAAAGFAGPRTVIEGRFGFLRVFCTEFDEAELTRGLGEEFVVASAVLKRYPMPRDGASRSQGGARSAGAARLYRRRCRERSRFPATPAWSSGTIFSNPAI